MWMTMLTHPFQMVLIAMVLVRLVRSALEDRRRPDGPHHVDPGLAPGRAS